jgi:hypothetical protein
MLRNKPPRFEGVNMIRNKSANFKQKGGQHLPECHAIFQNNLRKTSGLFPGLGGQHDPDYPPKTSSKIFLI